jgi:tetratricopeptide (TPR) repeat protein
MPKKTQSVIQPKRVWNQPWLAGALMVALTIAGYLPALNGGFIWDDDIYVTNNPLLTAPDGLQRIWFSLESPSQYFPLVYTTFRVERGLWGLNPTGYHWVNLLLHIANALLVWRLLWRLKVPGAWLAGAIFALHPVQVESVAWITERKNVLMGFFFLLALLGWVEFVESKTKRRWLFYAFALISYLLALSAKTTACTLPAALFLILWLQRKRISWQRVGEIAPFIFFGLAMGMVSMWWERYHIGTRGVLFALSPLERILIASRGVWFYFSKLFWPSNLTFIYPKWKILATDPFAYFWLVASGVLVVAIYFARRFAGRSIEVAALFFVTTLVPVLGFIMLYTFRYTFVADHYQYLAMIGPMALISAAVTTFALSMKNGRHLVRAAGCLILVLLTILTWQQSTIYRDIENLWRSTISRNPGCALAYNNLGNVVFRKGQVDEAIGYYETASEKNPNDPETQYNLGVAFLKKGRMDEAVSYSQKALEIQPDFPGVQYTLGNAFLAKGDFTQAISSYQTYLRVQPNDAVAHDNLAISLLATGKINEAIDQFGEALRSDPNCAEAHYNLGHLLVQLGHREEAMPHLIEAVRLKPDYSQAKEQLRQLGARVPQF